VSIHNVNPDQLIGALLANGWQIVGERRGLYKRLTLPTETGERHTFLVPLNPEYSDYEDLMGAVLSALERLWIDGQDAHRVLHRLDPRLYQ
jgi:hypothetical protein